MSVYLVLLNEITMSSTTFKDKNATRVGKGSIGVEIPVGLLSGGNPSTLEALARHSTASTSDKLASPTIFSRTSLDSGKNV